MNKTIGSSKEAVMSITRSAVGLAVGATILTLLLSACVPLPPGPGPGPGPMSGPGSMRVPLSNGQAPSSYYN